MRVTGDITRQFGFQTRSRKTVEIKKRFALLIPEFGKAQPAPVAEGDVILGGFSADG
jgi:hypothetical protein